MDKELCNAIDKIAEKIGIAIDWSGENVMPYVQDIMERYRTINIIQNAIFSIIAMIVLIICVIIGVKEIKGIIKGYREEKSSIWIEVTEYKFFPNSIDLTGLSILMTVILPILFVIFSIIFIYTGNDLLNWIYVPEVKFLELLKDSFSVFK